MKKVIVLIILQCISRYVSAQESEISFTKDTIRYGVENRSYVSLCITIRNNSNEIVYLWLNQQDYEIRDSVLIARYFLKQNGDYKLVSILGDALADSLDMILFKTFVKRILPREKFEIILISRLSTAHLQGHLLDRKIAYFKASQIPNTFLNVLEFSKDKLFKSDKIVLDPAVFEQPIRT
jgi:hypothetical protein